MNRKDAFRMSFHPRWQRECLPFRKTSRGVAELSPGAVADEGDCGAAVEVPVAVLPDLLLSGVDSLQAAIDSSKAALRITTAVRFRIILLFFMVFFSVLFRYSGHRAFRWFPTVPSRFPYCRKAPSFRSPSCSGHSNLLTLQPVHHLPQAPHRHPRTFPDPRSASA